MFHVPSNRSLNQGPNRFCFTRAFLVEALDIKEPSRSLLSLPGTTALWAFRCGTSSWIWRANVFFLYKSHWICGKGCFSGHHQSTYLWFGFIDTRLGQKSLKQHAMNPPSLFVSFCVWMARNLSKSSLPASLRGQQIGSQRRSWLEQVL